MAKAVLCSVCQGSGKVYSSYPQSTAATQTATCLGMTNAELITKARSILGSEPLAYTQAETTECFQAVVDALESTMKAYESFVAHGILSIIADEVLRDKVK